MKKIITIIMLAFCAIANAQIYMNVNKKDGTVLEIMVNNIDSITWPINESEYVDLGLSVKWATCNVGASSPEEYGDYFAWGETAPKISYSSSSYFDSSYTKYNINGGKTTLDLEDDAAYVNWGGDWRMPTDAEMGELRMGCYWEWTSSYNSTGIAGYIVYKAKSVSDKGVHKDGGSAITPDESYSLSDTHIFLPAAGFLSDSYRYGAGSVTYYWSSSLFTDSGYAYITYGASRSRYDRWRGQSVRPVCQ